MEGRMGRKQKLHDLAMKRFGVLQDIESDNRAASLEDLRFVYNVDNGQWPDEIRNERKQEKRPCLTSNKLRKFVAQVANQMRDQRLAGKVRPVDDKADVLTAKVIEGLIRQIENASNAEKIYTEAGEKAIAGGFGYWRIYTRELDDSFDQEVFIGRIRNQFSVLLDRDKNWAFIRDSMIKDEFKDKYPGKQFNDDFESITEGEEKERWYEDERIYIAEYFYKERYNKEIAEVTTSLGEIGIVELVKKEDDAIHGKTTRETLKAKGLKINVVNGKERVKKSRAYKVKWAKLTGHEVIEEGEWAGKEIPIIEVEGDWVNIAGTDHKRSMIRDAKDPQRGYNYWKTNMAETVALVPKSPYIAKATAIKDDDRWDDANKKNYSVLTYKGNDKPSRESPATIPTGAAQMMSSEAFDIMDTIGMFEAGLGQKSNERTGVAIRERANRSNFGIFHFIDNHRRAIEDTIRQLIDVAPKYYDTKKVVRILGEDSAQAMEIINQSKGLVMRVPGEEGNAMLATINSDADPLDNKKILDLNYGKYDVVEGVKLMSTRREEQLQGIRETIAGSPQLQMLMAPSILKNMDWDGAQEIGEFIKANLPLLLGVKPQGAGAEPDSESGAGGVL